MALCSPAVLLDMAQSLATLESYGQLCHTDMPEADVPVS